MTVYQESIEALTNDPRISVLYRGLSAGDRSILSMLLDSDSGACVTTDGSPNSKFWQCLSDHGWMVQEDNAPLPQTGSVLSLQYRLTDRGYRAIPVILVKLAELDSKT